MKHEECKSCENFSSCGGIIGEIVDEVKKFSEKLTDEDKLTLLAKSNMKIAMEQREFSGMILTGLAELNEKVEKIEKVLNVKTYDFIG